MTTYSIQYAQIVKNHVTVTTLTPNEIALGQDLTVSGSTAPFNGTHSVYALPQFLLVDVDSYGLPIYDYSVPIANAVQWIDTQSDQAFHAHTGTITYNPVCTWVTAAQIEDWLGIGTASSLDAAFLTQCASASNAFCYRRRQEAGYTDSLSTSPSGDVSLGTIQYGGMLYRQRGSIDSFASFNDMGGAMGVTGLSGVIKQLLGIDRPQCA
jgi:hypothetical protein